jgi:hypothetical protein
VIGAKDSAASGAATAARVRRDLGLG